MTERFEELIWAEMDGELSADEERELAELRTAAGDPARQAGVESEIRQFAKQLAEIEDLEAPAALRGRILEAIDRRPEEVVSPRSGPWQLPTTTPTWAKWGYMAAVLAIGTAVYWFASGPALGPENVPELVGTAMPAEGRDAAQLTGMPDFVRFTVGENRLAASIESGPGVATFVFAASDLGVERIDFRDGATGSHESDSNQVIVRLHGPGSVEVVLAFAQPELPFTFSAFGTGIEPFKGEFFLRQLTGS